jgi:peptidoglycan/LPS O-acetylase OafA/YrhL
VSSRLPHLPGLDGVRAVAVAAVLLFHLPAQVLPGGFLGVDVFFVLSGFLITSLLLAEVETSGRLRFGAFYARRARRLLPALFLVLAFTTVLALTVAQDAAAQLRQDALAALTYTTNWWFVVDARSYFEVMGRPPLLQHLWSLALEEQFYLVWPAVMLVVWRRWGRRGVGVVAVLGALASTAAMAAGAVFGSGADTARLYFGSDTHAMTVLAGAALATVWRPARMALTLPRAGDLGLTVAGVASLVGLTACFALAGEGTPWLYRGGFLGVAVLAAVLVLASSHPGARFGRVLGTQPLGWLGTRSYGIYLWHWPVFLVTRPNLDLPFGGPAAAATSLVVTFCLAEASYRWVEMPIRRGALTRVWRRAAAAGALRARHAVALGAAAVCVTVSGGAALAAVPAVGAADYLGGVTSMGAGELPTASPPAPAPPEVDARPLWRQPVTAIGDSVLLSARSALASTLPRLTIDASISRQPYQTIDRVRDRLRAGALSRVVVIETGTNGIPDARDLHDLLLRLRGAERVVLVNVRSPVPWMDQSNRALANAAASLDNVVVADWEGLSAGHRDYFVADGTHLTPRGADAYAGTIAAALG